MSRYSFNSSGNSLPAQRILGPAVFSLRLQPHSSRNGWPGKPRFDSAWQVSDTTDSVRQGTTDLRQGNNPTCFD